jgi:hypothetical protein
MRGVKWKLNYMLNLAQKLKTKVYVFGYESDVVFPLRSNNLIF